MPSCICYTARTSSTPLSVFWAAATDPGGLSQGELNIDVMDDDACNKLELV